MRRVIYVSKKVRDKMLLENPICEVCKIFVAVEIHHIIPVCDGGTNDRENLSVLCKYCHLAVPGKYPDGYVEEFEIYRQAGGIFGFFFKMGYISANNELNLSKYKKDIIFFQKTLAKYKKDSFLNIHILMA